MGVVVESRPPVQGLASVHMRHVLSSYPQVYYVYFSGGERSGPYHVTELRLKQACQTASSIDSCTLINVSM